MKNYVDKQFSIKFHYFKENAFHHNWEQKFVMLHTRVMDLRTISSSYYKNRLCPILTLNIYKSTPKRNY